MDTLQSIKAFLETIDAGGFSAAGRRLGIAPSVVMKRVNHLEHMLKMKLLHRSTRSIRVTEDGQKKLLELRSSLAALESVLNDMRKREHSPRGHLKIGAPHALTILHFSSLISRFANQYPDIRIDLHLIDRPLVKPVDDFFDISIAGTTQAFAKIVDIPLFPLKRVICAAPEYLARKGTPTHPNHLFSHRLLTLRPSGAVWEFKGPRGPLRIETNPVMESNDSMVLAAAALAGNGLAMLPGYACIDELRSGRLVEVLARYPISEMWCKAFVEKRRLVEEPIRIFLEWLQAELSPVPVWERQQYMM